MTGRSKKFIILIFIIFAIAFTACSDNNSDNNNNNGDSDGLDSGGSVAENGAAADLLADGLGERDFNGKELRVLIRGGCAVHTDEIYQESAEGDTINDAVYNRNRAVEARFNAAVTVIPVGESPESILTDNLSRSVLAGMDEYDLAVGHMTLMGMSTANKLYLDWYQMPNIDLEKPWWIEEAASALSVAGRTFLAASHMTHSLLDYTYCIFFNKQVAQNYGIEDLYKIVNDGKWTLAYLHETVKDMYIDLDNDGRKSIGDFYGFVTNTQTAANVFLWGFDQAVAAHNSDGLPELVVNTPKTVNIIEKLYELYFETQGVLGTIYGEGDVGWWAVPPEIFAEDRTLFATGHFSHAITNYRGMDTPFGIIPYPKWDEAQDKYYTIVDGHGPLLGIPRTVRDIDFVTVMAEALSAEGYKQVTPAYYEVALKIKFVRDAESVMMLDKIMDGLRYDFAYIYDGWGGLGNVVQNRLTMQNKNFASHYESHKDVVQGRIDTFIAAFLES